MRVLIVEDDEAVARYISKGLIENGHNSDVVHDGREGLFRATTEQYDVLIIDRMLPIVDGLALLNSLRTSGIDTPALILSALGKVDDKVKGLRSGADDYLVKPFAFEELMARLEVIASRTTGGDEQITELSSFDLRMDLLARQVFRCEQHIALQDREFRLLEYLLRRKGQVVTRTMLLENVWDYSFDPQTNVIDVHISRLRNKVDKGFNQALIETVRGAGYRLLSD
ncbi:MAG: response regulator transcription factor [Pseudomonadota bacterium]